MGYVRLACGYQVQGTAASLGWYCSTQSAHERPLTQALRTLELCTLREEGGAGEGERLGRYRASYHIFNPVPWGLKAEINL